MKTLQRSMSLLLLMLLVSLPQISVQSQDAHRLYLPFMAEQDPLYLIDHVFPTSGLRYSIGMPYAPVFLDDTLYFLAGCSELWSAHAAPDSAQLELRILRPFDVDYFPIRCPVLTDPLVFEGALFFMSEDPENHVTLWRSDGTAAGTTAVYEFQPSHNSAFYPNLAADAEQLYLLMDEREIGSADTHSCADRIAGGVSGDALLYE